MAIIYTYPAIGTPENSDIMLISDVSLPNNGTRSITLADLSAFILPSSIVTGTGTAGEVSVFTGTNSVGGSQLYWDSTTNRLGINTAFPKVALHVDGSIRVRGDLQVSQQNNNTFVGENVTNLNNITGSNNTSLGDSVMPDAVGTSYSTGIGSFALNSATGGTKNVAVGSSALLGLTVGSNNVVIGHEAGKVLNGNYNVVVGAGAFTQNVGGSFNTIIGYDAGTTVTGGGQNNILIGYNAEPSSPTASKEIVIGSPIQTESLSIPGIQVGANDNDVLTYDLATNTLELQPLYIQLQGNPVAPSATTVGSMRYRSNGVDRSFVEVIMQTGPTSYGWALVVDKTW